MNYFLNDQSNQNQADANQGNQADQNQDDTANISADDVNSDMTKIFDHGSNADDPFVSKHDDDSGEKVHETANLEETKENEGNHEPDQAPDQEIVQSVDPTPSNAAEEKTEFVQQADPTPAADPDAKLEIDEVRYKGKDKEKEDDIPVGQGNSSSGNSSSIMKDIEDNLLGKKTVLDKQKSELEEKISKIDEMLKKIGVIKDQASEDIKFSEEI
jgi:hypothetical protein